MAVVFAQVEEGRASKTADGGEHMDEQGQPGHVLNQASWFLDNRLDFKPVEIWRVDFSLQILRPLTDSVVHITEDSFYIGYLMNGEDEKIDLWYLMLV